MALMLPQHKRYDDSYTEDFQRKRHGLPWEDSEYVVLKALFHRGYPLDIMCKCMERPPAGILAKLVSTGCIGYDSVRHTYYYSPSSINPEGNLPPKVEAYLKTLDKPIPLKTKPKKETIMAKTVKIETKTFINEIDAATLTDEQIFAKIAELEGVLKSYAAIGNKPKKLVTAMLNVERNIQELVTYVDGRP